jgi:ubiquinone/menaquinone biosynthesis C-methylase UbiE
MSTTYDKSVVKSYWERKTCGAQFGMNKGFAKVVNDDVDLRKMAEARYRLEPFIPPFANFPSAKDKRLLEVGVGGGVDFSSWVSNGAIATGIDLTEAGIKMTRRRLTEMGIAPDRYRLFVGDAENLAFPDESFDIVYSWGVLHASPDTSRAFREVHRVLKRGGEFRGMIYHLYSWVAIMFWFRHGLLEGRPFRSPRDAMFHNLESPGQKTYTRTEARQLVEGAGFVDVKIHTQLGFGDTLDFVPREKYRSAAYKIGWALWPRWLVRLMGNRWGGNLMITARKA